MITAQLELDEMRCPEQKLRAKVTLSLLVAHTDCTAPSNLMPLQYIVCFSEKVYQDVLNSPHFYTED